ncbi:MAG: hypothetical protein FJ306_02885 [Planctomycetes bacterium]|nr:hypothetical protein [Planctomycetota bacterium]
MNHQKLLSLVTALALCAPGFAQGEIDLKVTTKKGASVWLVEETKSSQVIDMQGQEMETGQTITKYLQFTVKDVDDKGVMTIETKIARVVGSMALPMGMGDMEVDSAAPAEEEEEEDGMGMGAMMGGMKKAMTAGAGKTFTAKVDAKGKVVELMDDAKELLTDSGGGGGRMMGGGAMTEASLKYLVSSAFGELPAKPVAVGGKWERSEKDSAGRMPSNNKFDLTLAKADAESFEVTIAGTVETPAAAGDADTIEGDDEQAEMQREIMKSMQMKNGKIAGLCKASRTDGFVTEANLTISMDVEMSAGQMGDMAMSIKTAKSMKRTTEAAAAPKKAEPKKEETKPAAPTTGGGK